VLPTAADRTDDDERSKLPKSMLQAPRLQVLVQQQQKQEQRQQKKQEQRQQKKQQQKQQRLMGS
jgi:hypothetical protein